MNAVLHLFGLRKNKYIQYPDDHSDETLRECVSRDFENSLITIIQEGTLVRYVYLRRMGRYKRADIFGLSLTFNGMKILDISAVYLAFYKIFIEIVKSGKILEINGNSISFLSDSLVNTYGDYEYIKSLCNKIIVAECSSCIEPILSNSQGSTNPCNVFLLKVTSIATKELLSKNKITNFVVPYDHELIILGSQYVSLKNLKTENRSAIRLNKNLIVTKTKSPKQKLLDFFVNFEVISWKKYLIVLLCFLGIVFWCYRDTDASSVQFTIEALISIIISYTCFRVLDYYLLAAIDDMESSFNAVMILLVAGVVINIAVLFSAIGIEAALGLSDSELNLGLNTSLIVFFTGLVFAVCTAIEYALFKNID